MWVRQKKIIFLIGVIYTTAVVLLVRHIHYGPKDLMSRIALESTLPLQRAFGQQINYTIATVKPTREIPASTFGTTELEYFKSWRANQTYCSGGVVVRSATSVLLKDVIINTDRVQPQGVGGEPIGDVINRNEDDEFFRYSKGFFQVQCNNISKETKEPFKDFLHLNSHHQQWAKVTEFSSANSSDVSADMQRIPQLTIALTRYEYANVYWIVMELYDAFLSAQFYGVYPTQANILILDAHSSTTLDEVWGIFNKMYRLSDLKTGAMFSRLVWNIPRKLSPFILTKQKPYPLLNEFRHFVLSSLGIDSRYDVDCDSLRVRFIWRHDYVAHPRNPSGIISRKIANEEEILSASRNAFPSYNISGIQLDSLSVKEQLRIIAEADVLVGMHGAAFGYLVFMTPKKAVVELWPYNHSGNWHMKALATANNLVYNSWTNRNKKNEDLKKKRTTVPPKDIVDLIKKSAKSVCGSQ